ncbi:hypothetical protein MRX96_012001 [Rhipicephalus microplus]
MGDSERMAGRGVERPPLGAAAAARGRRETASTCCAQGRVRDLGWVNVPAFSASQPAGGPPRSLSSRNEAVTRSDRLLSEPPCAHVIRRRLIEAS